MGRSLASVVLAALAASAAPARAQPADAVIDPGEVLNKKLAVWRFDALGMNPEIVQRHETW